MSLRWDSRSSPTDRHLVAVAQKKAEVSAGFTGDIIRDFFPESYKTSGKAFEIRKYLADRTRYNPRDYLRLLTYLGRYAPESGPLDNEDIRGGVGSYCEEYFVEAVQLELHGVLERAQADELMARLRSLRGHIFRVSDLSVPYSDVNFDLNLALQQLFRAGAVANYTQPAGGRIPYYNFSYRNSTADLDSRREMILHEALRRGLNIPAGKPKSGPPRTQRRGAADIKVKDQNPTPRRRRVGRRGTP